MKENCTFGSIYYKNTVMTEVQPPLHSTDITDWEQYLSNHGMPSELPTNPVLSIKIAHEVDEITEKLGRAPTLPELLKIKPDIDMHEPRKGTRILTEIEQTALSKYGVRIALRQAERNPLLAEDQTFDIVWAGLRKDLLLEVIHTYAVLTDNDKEVLLRFRGIAGHSPMSLEDISQELGLELSYVKKVNSRAFRRLKAALYLQKEVFWPL